MAATKTDQKEDSPEFEDYRRVSSYYDETRVDAGCEDILAKECQETDRVLDAGCGTGNYTVGLAPFVSQVDAFEFNESMLSRCQEKVEQRGLRNVVLVQGSLLEKLPYEDGTFDGIMINQVIHHLDDGTDPEFPNLRRLLKEFQRVLKPGGWISINLTTRKQAGSFWWQHLMPRAQQVYLEKHIPDVLLFMYLKEVGFSLSKTIQCKTPLQGSHYFNPAGPLDEVWRNGDSTWSTLSNEELKEIIGRVKGMLDSGKAGLFMDQHDEMRRQIGQSTFIIARK